MDVKEAIATAKAYVEEVFSGEDVSEVELEETEFEGREWRITVSFARPRPRSVYPDNPALAALNTLQNGGKRRLHKVIMINADGRVIAMKDRAWMESA